MAFKMNPKSPLLMKAMGISPAKNMNKGYGPAKTSSPAKQRSAKDMTPAEEKAMADKSVFGPDGKNVAKPPKNQKKSKYDILFEDIANKAKKKKTSPAKQTAKQKANLPKEIVNAIAAKSPAKQVDKAGQRIIRQGEKAEAAYKAGNVKKGNRHKVRAKRMGGRYDAKMLKNNLKGGLRNNNAQG